MPFNVRCIFGSEVQKQAEEKGMKEWCDEHCSDGLYRSTECYCELKDKGIRIK